MSTLSMVRDKSELYHYAMLYFHVLAALRVIKSLYQNPARGMRKKAEYEQNIALSEAFLEAVPTTLIIFIAWIRIGKHHYIYPRRGYSHSVFKLLYYRKF